VEVCFNVIILLLGFIDQIVKKAPNRCLQVKYLVLDLTIVNHLVIAIRLTLH
jgi:hypothetical protein